MISKKRRHQGLLHSAIPSHGLSAFKGILHPLILGGQSIAPSLASTPNFTPYEAAVTTVPTSIPSPENLVGKDACEMSATEKAYCQVGLPFSFCDKKNLRANDPKCTSGDIKCPLTEKWKKVCLSNKSSQFDDFCKSEHIINGLDGECVDQAMETQENKQKQAYDDWVNSRGCNLGDTFDPSIHQTYKPCWPAFKDAKIGDIRPTKAGYADMRLLSWIPDKPLIM